MTLADPRLVIALRTSRQRCAEPDHHRRASDTQKLNPTVWDAGVPSFS